MKNATARRYVALGDSVSIALYPEWDARERLGRPVSGLGAADLLVRNNDELWPEFEGQDLTTLVPGLEYDNLAEDGGTMTDVLGDQLKRLKTSGADLVTLTVGGNDLLELLASVPSGSIADGVGRLIVTYRGMVSRIRDVVPSATIVLTTVYDPTDGTGIFPGSPPLPIDLLTPLNDAIREVAASHPRLALADVHRHFLGHGLSAPVADRWYWSGSIIEPSMKGASEVRRLWLHSLAQT